MDLAISAEYRHLCDQIAWSRDHGYGVFHLTDDDVALGRLFAYAFRTQTVGAFRAARLLLDGLPEPTTARRRAVMALRGLEELSLVPAPAHLDDDLAAGAGEPLTTIRDRFVANLSRVTGSIGSVPAVP